LFGGLAQAAQRDDADQSEYYFTSSDGITTLHADVLRPKGMAPDVKTPVILTVSPYTNHAAASLADSDGTGASPRFYDFLDLSHALERGYTYVIVDLPGDGGSGGCNDWGGVREQGAVRAAVEWAAEQSWSTGKVALLGKSYDGWTGLMGVAQQPKGLAAVVSLEPVFSGYRYIYMNGVRRAGFWPYGSSFTTYDAQLGPSDEMEYNVNSAPQAWCYPVNIAGQNVDWSETGPYWTERNLVPTAEGKTTPVFLTQGFLETNTKSDGAFEYWNSLAGTENRAWFGQFDHCRAWETQAKCGSSGTNVGDTSRWAVGHPGFIDDVMTFLDEHLKGIAPEATEPKVEVQDTLGRWRYEESWPPADTEYFTTELRPGTYTDDGSGAGRRPNPSTGIWTVSQPLEHDAWIAGTPTVSVSVDAVPNANIAANVYDIDPSGKVTMISRGVQSLSGTGIRNDTLTLYGQDWPIPAGHRLAIRIGGADTDEFQYGGTATRTTVTVRNARLTLPFLTNNRTEFLEGTSTGKLEQYLAFANVTITPEQIAAAQATYELPGPLTERPVGAV
jgi:predicted acyl esterase